MRREDCAHEIDLGQHTNSPRSFWVDFSGHLEAVRVGQVGVGSSDSEDDTARFRNVLVEHVSNLLLDIAWLVTDGDFGQTR